MADPEAKPTEEPTEDTKEETKEEGADASDASETAEAPKQKKKEKKSLDDYLKEGWVSIDQVRRPPSRPPPKTPHKQEQYDKEKAAVWSNRVTSTRTWYSPEDEEADLAALPEAAAEEDVIPEVSIEGTELEKQYKVSSERAAGLFALRTTATKDGASFDLFLKNLETASGCSADDLKSELALLKTLPAHPNVRKFADAFQLSEDSTAVLYPEQTGVEVFSALSVIEKYTTATARSLFLSLSSPLFLFSFTLLFSSLSFFSSPLSFFSCLPLSSPLFLCS